MNTHHDGRRRAADGIVIAGGGLAAQRCAETLRRCGSEEPIRILCAEPHRPYDRPPLSKELLAGAQDPSSLSFREPEWYERNAVDLLCGVAARHLSAADRRIEASDGSVLCYRKLLIATGGRPRTLAPLLGYENVLTLRSLDDALELQDRLVFGTRLAIIGAGFIGLEIASTARGLGAEVTVIEAAPAPLHSVLGESIGAWFARLHDQHGVAMRLGHTVVRVHAQSGTVRGVTLADGSTVAADLIVVGVGTDPDIGWLADSGIGSRGGVKVDPNGQSSCPDVFAAGDAAATYEAGSRAYLPGSHWEGAARQAAGAARLMLGLDPGRPPAAAFWTDQYGLRIQYVGRSRPGDGVALDGDPEANDFTATYTRAGRVVAVLAVNRPRALPAARALIEREDHDVHNPDRRPCLRRAR